MISSATGQTYKTTPEDIGKKVAGYVRATYQGYSSDWFLGGMSNTIINMTPKNEIPPKVVGEPVVGQTLSSSMGGWQGHDMSYDRRWFRCEADGLG